MFDLDALEAEALGEPFTFQWKGETYTMPVDMPLEAGRMFGTDSIEAFRLALGADVWDGMPEPPGVEMSKALVDAYLEHHGFKDSGKSSGSSDNSTSTATE